MCIQSEIVEKIMLKFLYLGATTSCFKMRIVASTEKGVNVDKWLITVLILRGTGDMCSSVCV